MEFKFNEKLYYKDRHFCSFYKKCVKGNLCRNALTEQVIKDSYHFRLPVLRYKELPEHCFKKK